MATDISSMPVNGTHVPQNAYEGSQSYNGNASSNQNSTEIPKDEVGWYFVEQYYTTLSRSPEKLSLFYNKRSQFVLGDETDKVVVCVGQRAINDRIKELDFNECKVRVTNVDSQASDSNIVIQVIGEISNKSQPHKKFVQTFVLAGQTNGYFVLNDIFRYLVDEVEEETETPDAEDALIAQASPSAAAGAQESPETLTTSQDPVEVQQSAELVDKEIKEKISSSAGVTAPAVPTVNGVSANSEAHELNTTANALTPEVERPKEPVPTPVAASPQKKAATPVPASTTTAPAPTKPAVPKTWAGLLANSARIATPSVTPQAPTTTQAQQQPKTQAPAPASQSPAAAPAANEEPAQPEVSPEDSQQDEWTSVGDKRQQSRAQANNGAQEGPQHRAYIKNVNESIDSKQLKSLLEKFGEVTYFDVSRQKNCAFVDFKTAEGYKAAIDANPHQIGNDRVFVEERRMKPAGNFAGRGGGVRGGRGSPAAQGGNRGAFQGGRGGFSGRGRGGNAAGTKGRGGAQAA